MRSLPFFICLFVAISVFSQSKQDDLMTIVEAELQREMTAFGKANQPPYYLAYRIHDLTSSTITSSFGSLVGNYTGRSRVMVTDIKVGDYSFDNSHPVDNFDNVDIPMYGMH